MVEKKDYPVISEKEYYEMAKTQDICYQGYDEERLYTDTDDWVEDCYVETVEDIYYIIKEAKRIKVYIKDRFHLRVDWVKEYIADRAYNDYYMEDTDHINNWELIDEFVENFNKQQDWYTAGKQIAWLDLSEEVKQYYINYKDFTEEKYMELQQTLH